MMSSFLTGNYNEKIYLQKFWKFHFSWKSRMGIPIYRGNPWIQGSELTEKYGNRKLKKKSSKILY